MNTLIKTIEVLGIIAFALTGYYKARGVVRPVDGVGSVDEVERRIVAALK